MKVSIKANASPIDKVSQDSTAPSSLYVFNATAITKPHAIETLTGEISGYNLDVAVITKTHLKARHTDGSVAMTEFNFSVKSGVGGSSVCRVCQTAYAVTGIDRDNDTFELLWRHIYGGTITTFVGALYHPPKPKYVTAYLLSCTEESTNVIFSAYPRALIVLCGDMNTLAELNIIPATSLTPIVSAPKRGLSMLDRIYVSVPLAYGNIKIIASSVKSDHRVVIAYNSHTSIARSKLSVKHPYR